MGAAEGVGADAAAGSSAGDGLRLARAQHRGGAAAEAPAARGARASGETTHADDGPARDLDGRLQGAVPSRGRRYCFPLTALDGFSRYLLTCRGLSGTTTQEWRPVFQRLFQEYGLPEILRTDNGVPFATHALGRLSQLSVWWIRLGIYPELIEPSHPTRTVPCGRLTGA